MKKFKIKQDLKKDKKEASKDDKPKLNLKKPVESDIWKAYEPEAEDENVDFDLNRLNIDETSGAETNFNKLLEQSSKGLLFL
jgi:hypothetical protein